MTKAPQNRILRWVLVASLAVNLLVVGVVAGSFAKTGNGPRGGADLGVGPFVRALDADGRREVLRELRSNRQVSGEFRNLHRQGFREIIEVLNTEPFDPEAMQALFESQRGQTQAIQAAGQQALLEHLTDMTPEERAAFATRFETEIKRPRGPRRPRSGG